MLTDSAKYLDRTPQVLDISVFEPGNSNLESGALASSLSSNLSAVYREYTS
jgi:hypothetical protein